MYFAEIVCYNEPEKIKNGENYEKIKVGDHRSGSKREGYSR